MVGAPVQRPLAELSPMERRRNSPSWSQNTKKGSLDSSPFDPSPLASKLSNSPFRSNSPGMHGYWQNRDPASASRFGTENSDPRDSPSPSKRSSIENLKRASRVKNSNMFAREHKQEYDPMSIPVVERPLAGGRPLSVQAQNIMTPTSSEAAKKATRYPVFSPLRSPIKLQNLPEPQQSPTRGQTSPAKSSLQKNSRYGQAFDSENGTWSEEEESFTDHQLPEGKSLHRHAKSVTFDAAPPQVNEYEMTTPDPSSVASGSREGSFESGDGDEDESFDRGSSTDREDSFDASLEDTDKTPVVLPEDWRFMSPGFGNEDLARCMEDPFNGDRSSPAPNAIPWVPADARPSPSRTDSVNSNGEHRPLPPLPPQDMATHRDRSDSNNTMQGALPAPIGTQRDLPSLPRPASISKAELQGMSATSMTLEDRLKLMMVNDDDETITATKTAAEDQRERRMRRGGQDRTPDRVTKKGQDIQIHVDEEENEDVADLGEYQLPPRISRESILRKVKSQKFDGPEYDYSSPASNSSPGRAEFFDVDPDLPLPSLEDRSVLDAETCIVIKQEEDSESEVDVYSIPEMYQQNAAASNPASNYGEDFPMPGRFTPAQKEDDDESHYSTDMNGDVPQSHEEDGGLTPTVGSPCGVEKFQNNNFSDRMSLPQFASMLGQDDFGLSLSSYMTAREPTREEPMKCSFSQSLQSFQRPTTPEAQIYPPRFAGYGTEEEENRCNTPDSVIRHSLTELSRAESPIIPEPIATIKASGSKLKTRPSLAPADIKVMAETRRQISASSDVPPIPDRHHNRPSLIPEGDTELLDDESRPSSSASSAGDSSKQAIDRRSSLVQLEMPVEHIDEGLSINLESEFDRVIEAQKKGYCMRQNSKMVVASSASHESNDSSADELLPARGTRSAGSSPRKQDRTQTWTTEPWNGKTRRKSLRQSGGIPAKRAPGGPAPPMPGMASNVTSAMPLDSVAENEILADLEQLEDGSERGRLFLKVVGVKELDLPLPRGERSYFALTLDNGLHCVTTQWLELGKYAPIGQEFELVVLNDLEFQLTLQTKIEEPKIKPVESPTKSIKVQKPSAFSRVFASPRKRKELELKQQEEAKQRQLEEAAARRNNRPTAWDLLHNVVAKDGSFGRAYVSLKDHENRSYGRPYTVDIPLFNEWAMEEVRTLGSGRSSRSSPAVLQRKAPYRIGKLELQLLFVPKPKDASEDDMPKSMNACVRELSEAEATTSQSYEGHLSQQGGDCPYWRRRFFRLEESKLTAYHEATRQRRATIDLAKASKLIDDKTSLMQKEVSGKGGSRRKSAFACEEEGYMFVEEGFRVRFANGETIDFYADSAAEKDRWMLALADAVGKEARSAKRWTELVLRRDKMLTQRTAKTEQQHPKLPQQSQSACSAMRSAPSTPAHKRMSQGKRPSMQQNMRPSLQPGRPTSSGDVPPPVAKDPRHLSAAERRQKSRSMVF